MANYVLQGADHRAAGDALHLAPVTPDCDLVVIESLDSRPRADRAEGRFCKITRSPSSLQPESSRAGTGGGGPPGGCGTSRAVPTPPPGMPRSGAGRAAAAAAAEGAGAKGRGETAAAGGSPLPALPFTVFVDRTPRPAVREVRPRRTLSDESPPPLGRLASHARCWLAATLENMRRRKPTTAKPGGAARRVLVEVDSGRVVVEQERPDASMGRG